MRPRSALFPLQVDGARVLAEKPELAMLLDLGSGKTATTLTALRDSGALPAIVAAPARVAETVWDAEAREWEHLADLRVTPLVGTEKQRLRALATKPDIVTVSYENLLWLSDAVDFDSYRAVVFDELSRMKTPGTKRFRRMRARGMAIPRRIGLTGSPVPNHLLDFWGEMFMIAGGKPLGERYTDYKTRYFEPVDFFQRVWRLKGMTEDGEHTDHSKRVEAEIHRRAAPFCYVAPPGLEVALPPVRVNPIRVAMPPGVLAKQRQLEDELFTVLDSGVELEALQKSTLSVKLRQFASGAVYTDSEGHWEDVHPEKIAALDETLGELQGEPALVFFWYKHEHERIAAMLRKTGRDFASVDDPGAIDAWNRRKLEVLLAHPQSAGHGLNLQHGGHHLVWFALPWAFELWKQGNGRLARTGQRSPWVTASCLLCGAADARVLEVLQRKGAAEDALFAGLRIADLL